METIPKITLETPTGLALNGNVLTFNIVPYAERHQIVDGALHARINTNNHIYRNKRLIRARMSVKAVSKLIIIQVLVKSIISV